METWKRNDVRAVCAMAIIFVSYALFSHDSADRCSRWNLIKSYLSILGIILLQLQPKYTEVFEALCS